MQPLMPCTRPDFDGAILMGPFDGGFRIFLKLGAPTCLGPGASCPSSPPPSLGGPVGCINVSSIDESLILKLHHPHPQLELIRTPLILQGGNLLLCLIVFINLQFLKAGMPLTRRVQPKIASSCKMGCFI